MPGKPKVLASAVTFGALSRILQIVVRLSSVPLATRLLSPEVYGLWLIVNSFIGWIAISDFGVPTALQNRLIVLLQLGDQDRIKHLVAFAARLLGGVAIVVAVGGVLLAALVPVASFFHVQPGLSTQFRLVLAICIGACAISIPSRIGSAVFNAHRRLNVQPLSEIAVQLASVSTLLLATLLEWKSIFALVACSVMGILAGPVTVTFLAFRRYKFSIGASEVNAEDRKSLLSKGVFFFLTILGELLIFQSDAIVIGSVQGAAAVTAYLIPNTLWINFLQIQNVYLRPLWPILSEIYVRGDAARLRHILLRSLGGTVLGAGAFALGVIFLGDIFIRWWSHGVATLPPVMAWGFAAYIVTASIDNVLAINLNAFGKAEFRFGYTVLFGIAKVAVAIAVLRVSSIEWLPLAFAITMLCITVPFNTFGVFHFIRSLSRANPAKGHAGGATDPEKPKR